MKEYVTNRFSIGDVVRNKHTNQDGKIDDVIKNDDCSVKYEVHLPTDPHGWQLGTKEAGVIWREEFLIPSPNQLLK